MISQQLTLHDTLVFLGLGLFVLAIGHPRPSSSFMVTLGRKRTSSDAAWENALRGLAILGVGVGILGRWLAPETEVWAIAAALVPSLALLAGSLRAALTREPQKLVDRYVIPLDREVHYFDLGSRAWLMAHASVGVLTWAAVLLTEGPEGSLLLANTLLINLGVMVFVIWTMTQERLALPERGSEAYLELQLRRRRLLARFTESLLTTVSLSIALGVAAQLVESRGQSGLHDFLIAWAGLVLLVALAAPALFVLPPLARVQEALREAGGSVVLGTRSDGWKLGGFVYYAPEDPAVFVPKQIGIGVTVNLAHPLAWVFLVSVIVVPFALTQLFR